MEPSNGLMPRQDGHPFSRDFAMHISCKNRHCILYDLSFGCSSPACVEINDMGMCVFYLKQQNQPKPLNGD
jgi:hypothetical protein